MKTFSIQQIVNDLNFAANHYIRDVARDRLGGVIRKWFDDELVFREMAEIIELPPEPATLLLRGRDNGCGEHLYFTTVEHGDAFAFRRKKSPWRTIDIDELRADPSKLLDAVKSEIESYVSELPENTTYASVPSIHLCIADGLNVKWFLFGYFAVPRQTTLTDKEG